MLTNHGELRVRKRLNINKRSVEKLVDKAYLEGIKVNDAKGSLRRYMECLRYREKKHKSTKVIIYQKQAFVFKGRFLVTVFPIPRKYFKTVDTINRKRDNKNE